MLQSVDNANDLVRQYKEPHSRYMLKIYTDPGCVALTSDMFLVVGNRQGRVLLFNLRSLAYVGGLLYGLNITLYWDIQICVYIASCLSFSPILDFGFTVPMAMPWREVREMKFHRSRKLLINLDKSTVIFSRKYYNLSTFYITINARNSCIKLLHPQKCGWGVV